MTAPPQLPRAQRTLKADAGLLAITLVWGLTFVTVKDALADADPFTFLALRFAIGTLAAAALAGRHLRQASAWRAGVVLGGLLFLGYALQTFGLRGTTPSRSAFITGLAVVLVPFVSVLVLRRRPSPTAVLGVGLAAAGLYWLTGAGLGGPTAQGDLLTLGCAIAYSFHVVLTERYATREHPVALVTVQLLVTAVLSALFIPLGTPRLVLSGGLIVALLLTGVVASALAISVQVWAQARTTAVRAAVLFSLEPVFAAAYAALLGRERLGARELAGGALIVLGVLSSELGTTLLERRRRSRAS